MILEKYKKSFVYRPLDIFTLDALLFMAYDKHWAIQELTPIRMVPLQLGTTHAFSKIRDPQEWIWGRYDVNASEPWGDMRTEFQYEEIDLVHIAWASEIIYTHWRVGWRSSAKELVVGLDRNDEYVHFERRDLFKQSR